MCELYIDDSTDDSDNMTLVRCCGFDFTQLGSTCREGLIPFVIKIYGLKYWLRPKIYNLTKQYKRNISQEPDN